MTKKRKGTGRVTPKGTKPAEKKRQPRTDLPESTGTPPDHLPGKVGKQRGRVARPITHNRGNR